MAELNHVLDALHGIKTKGEYWGNKEQFWKRHDKLYEILVQKRDELKNVLHYKKNDI